MSQKKIGKYELRGELGRGAMGIVHLAYDTLLNREVALKIMIHAEQNSAESKRRFYREAQSAGSLMHDNIVKVFDLGEDAGVPYIVMEYLPGRDLKELMLEGKLGNYKEVLRIWLHICNGLHHAHKRGLIHRDIKPGNIRITSAGRVKIMDFGIAKNPKSDLTQSGVVLGTVDYMAPEQVKGLGADNRSDLFSLGVMFFEMLCLKKPFPGDSVTSVIYKIVYEEPEGWAPSMACPPDTRAIIWRLLDKNPQQRYMSAIDVARDLKASYNAWKAGDASLTHGHVSPSLELPALERHVPLVTPPGATPAAPDERTDTAAPVRPVVVLSPPVASPPRPPAAPAVVDDRTVTYQRATGIPTTENDVATMSPAPQPRTAPPASPVHEEATLFLAEHQSSPPSAPPPPSYHPGPHESTMPGAAPPPAALRPSQMSTLIAPSPAAAQPQAPMMPQQPSAPAWTTPPTGQAVAYPPHAAPVLTIDDLPLRPHEPARSIDSLHYQPQAPASYASLDAGRARTRGAPTLVDVDATNVAPREAPAPGGKLPLFWIGMVALFLGTLGGGALLVRSRRPAGPPATPTATAGTPTAAPASPGTTTAAPPPATAPAAPASGTVAIDTNIASDVIVDGAPSSATRAPGKLDLPPGNHHVMLKEPLTGAFVEGDVLVQAGKAATLSLPYTGTGFVILRVRPWANVTVDGNKDTIEVQAASKPLPLEAGKHTFVFSMLDHKVSREEVVVPGKTVEITVDMTAQS